MRDFSVESKNTPYSRTEFLLQSLGQVALWYSVAINILVDDTEAITEKTVIWKLKLLVVCSNVLS